ncbi:hypothetical protein [Kutzneria kofuensis]
MTDANVVARRYLEIWNQSDGHCAPRPPPSCSPLPAGSSTRSPT